MTSLTPAESRQNYTLPTLERLQRLEGYEKEFARQISHSIRWVYDIYNWNGAYLEKRVPGVKASVWQRYSQPAYKKARSMHVVAALSWVSQVSMSAILYGDRIAQYWPNATREKIRLFIFSGMLEFDDFYFLVIKICKIRHLDINKFLHQIKEIERLESACSEGINAPQIIDIEDFGREYYRSIAKTIKNFRVSCGFSVSDMAIALNLTDRKYRKIENEDNPVKCLSLHLAARLKLAFQIPNTVPFIAEMDKYRGFVDARNIQQHRELLYLDLLEGAANDQVALLADYTKHLADLNLNLNRCVTEA